MAQVKINLSVLDPLGLPLTTTIVSGESADDPLYVPEIRRVQKLLQGKKGVTYIGDCKMAALATRGYVASSGDYYVCPFAQVQIGSKPMSELLEAVFDGREKLEEVFSAGGGCSKPQKIAEGYEYEARLESASAGKKQVWRERRFVVRSLKYAEKQKASLLARIAEATQEIESLNERKQGKRRLRSVEELAEAAHQVLQKKRVEGLLKLEYEEAVQRFPLRKYAGREGSWREEKQVSVAVGIEHEAVAAKLKSLGFRVYGTNHPTLTLTEVVKGYRGQYVIEQRIGRLKGQPLSLSPLYLAREERIVGLIRLLTIALRALTLIEFQVRKKLQAEQSQLSEIYAGNPKRATHRPTTEIMLKAFGSLTLTKIKVNGQILIHLTPLTKVQETILHLLGFTTDAYLRLIRHSSKPLFNLSEP